MNNPWIISPNWMAWTLLCVATASLVAIAIRLWVQRRAVQPTTNQAANAPQSLWRNVERVITWLSFVLVLIGVGCLALIDEHKNNVTDFSALATVMGVLVTLLVGWSIYQVIETKDSLRDIVALRAEFNALRNELDILHQIHEAYVLSMEGEDVRREGHSSMAFEHHLNSAFLFMRDLVHYDMRFMHALALMRVSFDDVYRPAMGPRRIEVEQFILRRERYISQLEELLRQIRGRIRFAEQAEHELTELIDSIRNLQPLRNNFDEEGAPSNPTQNERR